MQRSRPLLQSAHAQSGTTMLELLVAVGVFATSIAVVFSLLGSHHKAKRQHSSYHGGRQLERALRLEISKAIFDMVEGSGTKSVCSTSITPGPIHPAGLFSATALVAPPTGSPKDFTDMAARCAGPNSFAGSTGHFCFSLKINDALLEKRVPYSSVEVTLNLTNQATGAPIDCEKYKSLSNRDRGFSVFYTIYYQNRNFLDKDFNLTSGEYFGGGSNFY